MTNAPILKGSLSYADKRLEGGSTQVPLNVTSSLGTNTAGTLVGAFTGTSGQGAGLADALNFNGNTGTTVSGVAVGASSATDSGHTKLNFSLFYRF